MGVIYSSCDAQPARKEKSFPPQSFSSGYSEKQTYKKKTPHWDYLVICSPNFYEVAFPFDFFLFIYVLFFHALCCYNFGGYGSRSTDLTLKME